MIGRTISHYEILERIGGGGMGEVFKARDTRLDRLVALKFLTADSTLDHEAGERFLREARAASALDHPNICVVHDVGETEDGRLWLCMAHYEGETLQQRLAEGSLPVTAAVRIGVQICRGLGRAHAAGIVHRDIKPANVMLTASNEIKLVDFGLARRAGEERLTSAGMAPGTVAYMSPEQVAGSEVDLRSDLWSLGVVLYQMLTGTLPFSGDHPLTVARKIVEADPDPPSALRPEISPEMEGIVGRLLEKAPGDRYASADEVAADLEAGRVSAHGSGIETAMFDSTGVDVSGKTASSIVRRAWSLRGRWWLWVGAAGIAAILAFGLTLRGKAGSADARPDLAGYRHVAVMPFANFTGAGEVDHLVDGLSAGLINSLAEIEDLQVVGRSEAWSYRGEQLSATDLGSRLGVDLLVEGSVQGSPTRLRVMPNLLEARTGGVLSSYEVTGSAERIFDLQRAVADRLIDLLRVSLSPRERQRLERDPTQSFQAYEQYLRGVRRLESATGPADLKGATSLFREAIRIDPGFALAHVGLSEALWWRSQREFDAELLAAAEASVDRALELDPELPSALVAKARIFRSAGRYDDSIAQLEEVLERHPNPDEAYREIASGYEEVGDLVAAEGSLRSAVAVASEDWFNWDALGAFLWRKGDYQEARGAFERAAELAPPEIHRPRENLAALELSQGRIEAALAAYEALEGPIHSYQLASNIGTAYYFSDRPDKWDRAEDYYLKAVSLSPKNDQVLRNLADLYLQTGRDEKATGLYREALTLVEARLEAEPRSHELRLRSAFYGARAGDCDRALTVARELAVELPPAAQSTHRLAYVWALCGERERALEAIRQAIAQGASGELMAQEDEFAALRDDPEFRELVGGPR